MDNLFDIVKAAGIVGAGGAGFPTHMKLNCQADYVLVNGAECEPLLRVDQQLMAAEAGKMLFALNACVEQVGAKQGIVGIKGKYHDAIDALEAQLPKYPKLSIHLLENVYPAGDEQHIVYELTGKVVPEGGIPLMVGSVVLNVETLLNIYDAIWLKQPVVDKYLTIAGAVKRPMTVKVPVGVSVRSLIELAGGALISDYKVIDGGPMMGKVMDSVDVPVKKASKGYIVLPADHPLILNKEKPVARVLKEAKTACCHCDLCTDVCPRYLLGHKLHPSKLMRIAGYQSLGDKNASVDEAFLCCECGLCEQACIMNLQPWKVNAYLKAELSKAGVQNSNKRQVEAVHPFRLYRGFPVKKLVYRLGLDTYDVPAALTADQPEFDQVTLLARQHIGKPSTLCVSEGDLVTRGQTVFKVEDGALGADIHASIDGIIIKASQDHLVIKKR